MGLLDTLGIKLDPSSSFSAAAETFNNQNLSPNDIFEVAARIPQTVGGIPGIGSKIPGLGKIPLPTAELSKALGKFNQYKFGTAGSWQAPMYASDLNDHHAKLKFLFKVTFSGFGVSDFFCYVHRCDKPKVRLNHQDVNYYNFRTRVLVSTTYDPLSITFLDEIGNSVNTFFADYLRKHSGTGNGEYGIQKGFGLSSSTIPYSKGYSDSGATITIEQIFANGLLTNRFVFVNARVESFDFDELSMEESAGSMMTMIFSYDALKTYTVNNNLMHTWGATDLLMGGGTSGKPNAHATSLERIEPQSATGKGMGSGLLNEIYQPDILKKGVEGGMAILNQVPAALSTAVKTALSPVGSGQDVVSSDIQNTLASITSGDNLKFGGKSYPTSIDSIG